MSLEEEQLVDLIEKFPHLWDKKHKLFKDKIAIENSWQRISKIMELTVDQCQEIWKSLRIKYIRERRIILKMPTGSQSYTCKWPLYGRMGFLNTVIATRKTKGNIPRKCGVPLQMPSQELLQDQFRDKEESQSQDEGDNTLEEIIIEMEDSDIENIADQEPIEASENQNNMPSSSESDTKLSQLRRERNVSRKRKNDIPSETLVQTCADMGKNLNSFLASDTSDMDKEDFHFGMSLAESLKGFEKKKKLALKAKIMLCLANAAEDV